MIRESFHAFLDDSGDSGLSVDKSGTSRAFALAAVIVADSKLSEVRTAVESVRSKHFQAGEMKSSGIGDNHRRRIRVLRDLRQVDFSIVGFIVHKDRVARAEGLKHHSSFVKFLSKPIYHDLCSAYEDIMLVADEHGDADFMRSFAAYLKREVFPSSLFSRTRDIRFGDSRTEVLIQLADLIAGTLRKCGTDPHAEHVQSFQSLLKPRMLKLSEWPSDYTDYVVEYASKIGTQEVRPTIVRYAISQAQKYCRDHGDEAASECRVCFIDRLLSRLRFGDPLRYVTTPELIAHIRAVTGVRLHRDQLRREVVGPLRDEDVLIASSRQGYKLPVTKGDLYDFVNHGNSIMVPMMARLRRFRDGVRLASNGEFDVLAEPEYVELREYLDRSER